ncbi:MAG: hypothetical protein HY238_17525 [Acidobacteria bacterium]|nr:hypothetical protein [Acidobacteriota bacterium]
MVQEPEAAGAQRSGACRAPRTRRASQAATCTRTRRRDRDRHRDRCCRRDDPRRASGSGHRKSPRRPNYICQEHIARFVTTSHTTNWQALDLVSAEVVYENGREHYRNIMLKGKPTNKGMEELPGAWSTGEFGTMLVDLFSPATAASFELRGESKSSGQPALLYDFEVDQENSHWSVMVPSQTIRPAYRGSVWIDKSNHSVLRIEMQARRLPREFPLDKVESAVDYQYVRFSESQFLLPVHAETLSCQRGSSMCSRNVIDFRNYHKYTSESNIIFNPK